MQLGIIGLGRMGGNIARRLMLNGHTTVVYDRNAAFVENLRQEGATGVADLPALVAGLEKPRAVWVMLPAGAPTEDTINVLSELLEPGDVIIDGGNTYYKDDICRAQALSEKGLSYIDVGTSGGVWGLERGYCMMIGGDAEVVKRLDPLFDSLAPGMGDIPRTRDRKSDDDRAERGYIHAGPAGSGHFVKMIHNGIEYGMMQAFAEGFDILKTKSSESLPPEQRFDLNVADIAEVWRRGSVVSSWLLDLTADALASDPKLDGFSGEVADSGEGRWTIEAAIEQAVPVPVLSSSLFARFRSRQQSTYGDKMLSAMRFGFGGHVETPKKMTSIGSKSKAEPAPPTTLFLFGAHGDLVKRLLMPALYHLSRDGLLGDGLRIIGVDHNAISDVDFAKKLEDFIRNEAASKGGDADRALDPVLWAKLARGISYVQGDFLDESTYQALAAKIAASGTGNAVFYLATAPRFFSEVVSRLGAAGLLQEQEGAFRRVVIEKPFGSDLHTAEALNACLLKVMSEKQIYRIDHYLGKETVQNILVSRFSNSLFEAFWNNHYIDHVQITAAETVGVETRGSFYEHTGALRDMVPNHLFQLLAMVAMEPPAAFGADAVRGEKAKVVGAIRPWSVEQARANSVRGQYAAGEVGGKAVKGYRQEANVAPDSSTETYVALKVMIDNWRWVGVPFYLRTGKRMSVRDTEIVICFKPAPYAQFRDTEVDELQPTHLRIQIQPNEGMWFDLLAKRPGPALDMANIELGFAYKDFFEMQPSTGYETLIYDCLTGDQTLFQRADNIENGWRAVQPFLDAWQQDAAFQPYKAGEDGPAAADDLLTRDSRVWHDLG
ncbi:glucose-6-phosphate dehydrogenase [Pseudomonas sp. H3_B11]